MNKVKALPILGGLAMITALALGGCGTSTSQQTNTTTTNSVTTATTKSTSPSATAKDTALKTTVKTKQAKPVNQPFVNRLKVEDKNPPDSKFDPTTISTTLYNSIPVVTPDGASATLSVDKTPIFFEAYWCPHCQRTLVMWNKNWSDLKTKPIIVATGFEPGTTIQQAKQLVAAEEKSLGLTSAQPSYYLLDDVVGEKLVKAFPELVFENNKSTDVMIGEHTLSVWEKAFS